MSNSDSFYTGLAGIAACCFLVFVYDLSFRDKEISEDKYKVLSILASKAPSTLKPLFYEISSDGVIMKSEFKRFEKALKQAKKKALLDEASQSFRK